MIIKMEQELYNKVTQYQRPNGKQVMLIIDMVSQLVKGGVSDTMKISSIGNKVSEVFLESSTNEAVWQNFEAEVLNGVIESYKSLCEQLRKKYCTLYSGEINKLLRKYFRDLMKVKEEPADIHPEFVRITKFIIEANKSQKDLHPQPPALRATSLRAAANQQLVKIPELIVRNRKYN